MDRLANPSWQVIVIAVVVLALARLALARIKWPLAKHIAEIFESLAIAIFLVFLIVRPFVVQAYFIPSGSMRPTLLEGDRIMVNKFIYRLREPERGEVIVFKSPIAADKNEADFIKRVIGLPGDKVKLVPGYVTIGDQSFNHGSLHAMLADYGRSDNLFDLRVKLTSDSVLVDDKEITKQDIAIAAGSPDAKVTIHPGAVYVNGKKMQESYVAEDPDQPYPEVAKTLKVSDGSLFVMGDNRNMSSDSRKWGLLDRNRAEGKAMFIFWPPNRIRWVH
ncbi:MAG: signal peptidase I [Armatimonadota bacterium]|nr:signal peptidase I [Armatimonadota bacterium]